MQAPDTFHSNQNNPAGTPPANPLLIAGASARAAAWSALRAGYTPFAFDLFADSDLADRGYARRITDYPEEILRASRQLPAMPWIYTGGLENYPDVVQQLANEKPLIGNSSSVLQRVRDPEMVAAALKNIGIPTPETTLTPPLGDDQRWLVKRRNSSAGLGVHLFRPNSPTEPVQAYYQQFIPGSSWSSTFLGNGEQAKLLGSSRQWIGASKLGGRGFLYCGSSTTRRSPVRRETLGRLGNELVKAFSLVGLFGVDWILHKHEPWPVEINPRYTASCELFERAHHWPLIRWHVEACTNGSLPAELKAAETQPVHGKGILYARRDTVMTRQFQSLADKLNETSRWPLIADIPAEGSSIAAGHPVVTLFAQGASSAAVRGKIIELALRIRRELVC